MLNETVDRLMALADEALRVTHEAGVERGKHGYCSTELAQKEGALIRRLRAELEQLFSGEPSRDEAYDKIDRYLRNNLGDEDYAGFSGALDALYAGQQPAADAHPMLEPTHICKDCGVAWRQCDDFSFNLRGPKACPACDNTPVGGQLIPITAPLIREITRLRAELAALKAQPAADAQMVLVPREPTQEWFDYVANRLHISDSDVKAMHDAFIDTQIAAAKEAPNE